MNKQLRYLVKLAYETTPLWRKKFDKANLKPEEIKTKDDLLEAAKKGVYLTPDDLYSPKVLPLYLNHKNMFIRILASSGTTGEPKLLPKTPDDMRRNSKALEDVYSNLQNGDRILNLFPPSPAASGPCSMYPLETLNYSVSVLHTGPAIVSNIHLLKKLIKKFSPTVIFGLPTTLYRLPHLLGEEIKNIRFILTGGEPTSSQKLKKILGKYRGNIIVDLYASCEDLPTAFLTIKKEEDKSDYMYKVSNYTLLELVDENFERVSKGEYGKILLTSLFPKNALPGIIFLNYLIGDEAIKVDEKYISGIRRGDETVSVGGAKENPATIEKIIFELMDEYPGLTGEYVVIWEELPDGRQGLEIRVASAKKYKIENKIKEMVFSRNYPYWELTRVGNAYLNVKIVDPDKVYPEGYKVKPGKPKRLLIKDIDF